MGRGVAVGSGVGAGVDGVGVGNGVASGTGAGVTVADGAASAEGERDGAGESSGVGEASMLEKVPNDWALAETVVQMTIRQARTNRFTGSIGRHRERALWSGMSVWKFILLKGHLWSF